MSQLVSSAMLDAERSDDASIAMNLQNKARTAGASGVIGQISELDGMQVR